MISTAGFTIDRPRQCRARGHVWARNIVVGNEWVIEQSDDCFRCGLPFEEAGEEAGPE